MNKPYAQELIDYLTENNGDPSLTQMLLDVEKIDETVSNYLVNWMDTFKEAYPTILPRDMHDMVFSQLLHIITLQRHMINKFQVALEPKVN